MTMHEKLKALYQKIIKDKSLGDAIFNEEKRMMLHLDTLSYRKLLDEREAFDDGSMDLYGSKTLWRHIPIQIHHAKIETRVVPPHPSLDTVMSSDLPDPLTCIYISVKKGNGRVAYFDDPDTDEAFR